jgi:hypothetical protein
MRYISSYSTPGEPFSMTREAIVTLESENVTRVGRDLIPPLHAVAREGRIAYGAEGSRPTGEAARDAADAMTNLFSPAACALFDAAHVIIVID